MTVSLPVWLLTIMVPCIAEVFGILGGKPVHLYRAYARVEVKDWLCGGTLVDHDKVLTAAHCLFGDDGQPVRNKSIQVVRGNFESYEWSRTASRFLCERYIIHESYVAHLDYTFNPYNIALIELDESVDLSLPENGVLRPCFLGGRGRLSHVLDTPQVGFAVGMGIIDRGSKIYSHNLRGVTMIHQTICSSTYRYKFGGQTMIHDINHVCFKSTTRGGTMCSGDAGSPIVHIEEGKAVCLIGIDIYGDAACDPTLPNVFIRASAFDQWISENIQVLSTVLSFDTNQPSRPKPKKIKFQIYKAL